jgi:hypothetical protein
LARTCTATKRDGDPCTLPSYGSDGLCWAHDPKNAERRRRGQSRGGKSKPSKELISIKQRLSVLADNVLEGSVDRGVAAVASQILNVYLRAIELERKIRETEELEERLAALERRRGKRWQMAGLERRIELIEAKRKRGKAQLVREALERLSDEELKAAEESLFAEARARGEQPPPNELLEKMKRWEAEAIERQRAYAEAHRTPSG